MTRIQKIREQLCLSQYQLAPFLGISRSLLAMAERGERQLSSTQWLHLLSLLAAHENKNTNNIALSNQDLQNRFEKMASALARKAKTAQQLASRLSNNLEKMVLQQQQSLNWLATIENALKPYENMTNINSKPASTENIQRYSTQQKWLELQKAITLKKIARTGINRQMALYIKIAAATEMARASIEIIQKQKVK